MTKVKIYALTGLQQYAGAVQYPDTLDFHSGTKAQFVQISDQAQVILEGTTGGKGSDSLMVGHGEGRDAITDFYAVGGDLKQGYLFISFTDYHIHKDGHDTVIEWDTSDLVRLIGVKRSDFDADDFHMFP